MGSIRSSTIQPFLPASLREAVFGTWAAQNGDSLLCRRTGESVRLVSKRKFWFEGSELLKSQKGANMAGTGKAKAKSDSLKAEEQLRQETELREEERLTGERIEQQDLNQGIDTGTHSSARHGVNWGPSYRVSPEIEQTFPTKKQIDARAYELYLKRGYQDGHDIEDWLIAEQELKQP